MISAETLKTLQQHGFMWMKDGSTDKVDEGCIDKIVPAANGFTVIYNKKAVLRYTTCVVEKIELAEKPQTTWNVVYWKSVVDERV
jgi:hypothetical protein